MNTHKLIIIILFYISVSSVNYLRSNYFYVGKSAEYSILKKEKPNYLIIHLITSLPLIMLMIFKFNTKFILRISGLPRMNFLRKILWKIAFKKIYLVTCPTLETYNYIKQLNIVSESRLKILYDPIIVVHKINKKKNEKINIDFEYFLAIGRLTRQKNFLFLCKSFGKILSKHLNSTLLIAGEGEEFNKTNDYIKKNNLQQNIQLIGYKENIFPYLVKSKGFILSSLWEDPGFVLIEAAYCRTPVFSSDAKTGPKELIQDNFNGTNFKNNSENDFIKNFDKFLENSKNKKIILENLKLSKKFSLFQHFKNLQNYLTN